MTFTLKDYNTLKSSFVQTLDILERRDKKIDSKRKKQIDFLNDVIANLDSGIQNVSRPLTKNASRKEQEQRNLAINKEKADAALTLSAVMAFMVLSINEQLSFTQGSLLRDRLQNDDLGINTDNTPTPLQYKKMYQQLNKFLQLLFIEHQATNGIKTPGELANVEIRTLVHWMRASYHLELSFFIDSLPNKLSPSKIECTKNATEDRALAKESSTILFDIKPFTIGTLELPDWEGTKTLLQNVIHNELAAKNLHNINVLSNETRRNQLNFLKLVEAALNTSTLPSNKKSAILLGAMHIIREQISKEYNTGLLSCDATTSRIHQELSEALGLQHEYSNKVDPLVNMAQMFITHLSIEETAMQTQVFRNEHALDSLPSEFLIDLLKLSQTILYTSRLNALNEAYTHYKTSIPTVKANHSSAFSFWNSKTPSTPKVAAEAPTTPTKGEPSEPRASSPH